MTRLLGHWFRSHGHLHADATTAPSESSWQPLPDDIAEWMGMNPYSAES